VKKIKPRPAWTGSARRTPSDIPPVELKPANLNGAAKEKAAKKTSTKKDPE
jgi:hypothetical protein